MNRLQKAITAAVLACAALASPASANSIMIYWQGGEIVGMDLYCDGGFMYDSWGIRTSETLWVDQYGYGPC